MKDTVVESVIEQFRERSAVGIKKYNTTLDRKDLSTREWQNHMKFELMDATLYLEKLIKQDDLLNEAMLVIEEYLEGYTPHRQSLERLLSKYKGNERV
jgi:hypothetical protein